MGIGNKSRYGQEKIYNIVNTKVLAYLSMYLLSLNML